MNKDDSLLHNLFQRAIAPLQTSSGISNLLAIVVGIGVCLPAQTGDYWHAAFFFPSPAMKTAMAPRNIQWGFALDDFHTFQDEFRRGEVLGKILTEHGVPYEIVHRLQENARGIFDISSLQTGKTYTLLSERAGAPPCYMIYEPSPYRYVVFHLDENACVEVVERDVTTQISTASGILETNFWQALTDNGLNDELADGIIDALSTSVDFYKQKVGDRFKVIYEKYFVAGKEVGTGKVLAAVYERDGKEYYAFRYDMPNESCKYFDLDGTPAKKGFLKSPLKFSRITSKFSHSRLHPILGHHRPHFGTDYAAPYGTPILAVADGIVTEASRAGGNGIYVKIRHDHTYETQYLHMQSHAKGIKKGVHVRQGQTIGYVGSTGLATGPHVCFRFWKNNRQIDHTKISLPRAKKMEGADFEQFRVVRDSMLNQLSQVSYRTREEIFTARSKVARQQKVKP